MLLEYSYDKCNEVIDNFKNSKIASLSIAKAESGSFVMDYTLIEDLPVARQVTVRKALYESLPERLQVVDVLNQFLEAQILNGVNNFSLRFNAIDVRNNKCEISYSSSFKTVIDDNKSAYLELQQCLERYDLLITKLGVSDVVISDIYAKSSSNKGRKYLPVTMSDFGEAIRKELGKG